MSYEKYICGHSDDLILVLIRLWSLSTASGPQLPEPLELPE